MMQANCALIDSQQQAVKNNALVVGAFRAFAVFCAILLNVFVSGGVILDASGLVAYTLLMLAYLGLEIWKMRLSDGSWNWLNPAVLASLVTFVLSFGISNVLFFMPEDVLADVGLEPVATPWMNQLMMLVVLAAVAMWSGYDSLWGRQLGHSLGNSRLMRQWMTTSTQVNRPVVFGCIAISLAARLLMIKLGVYGFSSDLDQLIANAPYTQYLSLAESLGLLSLLGLAIHCFGSSRVGLFDRQLFVLVLIYEVVFGFLSGFKSQVCMPFILVGFAFYSQRQRIPRWMLPAILIGIVTAYAAIEPFREARNHDASFDGTDLTSIATTMATAGLARSDNDGGPSTALSILARLNLTYVASKGIEYAATRRIPEDSPNFLGNIFLAPLQAFVPRLLWEGKPFQSIGLWYTVEVMGYGFEDGIYSSTAMGPVTYLNFAGGPITSMRGFFCIGTLQRGLFDGLRTFGGGGLIVFMGLLRLLVVIDSAYDTIFAAIIRLLPLLIFAQYLLFYSPHWRMWKATNHGLACRHS